MLVIGVQLSTSKRTVCSGFATAAIRQISVTKIGGEDGIRTHGAEDRTTAFETGIENSDRHGRQSILSVVAGPALGGMADERSDGEKHRAALSKAKALAKALDSAIESS
jgi:hypothetical protein